jgi:tetratricopeptide (TPR) repeat protein
MSNEPKAGKGIDPEMLAAYIDNRLPPDQRAAVEAQLATDPDSYDLLVDTLEALDDDEIKALEVKEPSRQPIPFAPKSPKSPFRNLMIAGGALAAAAAIVLAVMQPAFMRRYLGNDVDPRFDRLVAAVGEQRYIEPRLTGRFAFGPMRSDTRGPESPGAQNLALIAATAELQQLVNTEPTAENLHALGVAKLLIGDDEQAIELLGRSIRFTRDRNALSDLSAAYAHRARRVASLSDWKQALQTANEALQISGPPLSPTLFNRALAATNLGMESAAAYWDAYVAAESEEDWRSLGREYQRSRVPGGK